MHKVNEAFTAGRRAVKNRRTLLLLLVSAFMGIDAAIHELRAERYLMAVLAMVFFPIIAPLIASEPWLEGHIFNESEMAHCSTCMP
jgi:hypothetical protein